VPLALLGLRNLAISNVVGVLWAASMFAWFFLWALYMQLVLGYGAMQVGLAFLPSNLIMAACSPGLSAWVVMRLGIRSTLGRGLVMAAASMADARTCGLRAACASTAVALHGGYQLAFCVSAVAAGMAAVLGGLALRPAPVPTNGAQPVHA
jgi:hypothetical protein